MSKKEDDDGKFPWTTVQPDVRYPNQNASRFCFQMFVDYHRCTRLLGKAHKPCEHFEKAYKSLCPYAWVAKWNDQLKEGTFPLDLPEEQTGNKKK